MINKKSRFFKKNLVGKSKKVNKTAKKSSQIRIFEAHWDSSKTYGFMNDKLANEARGWLHWVGIYRRTIGRVVQ
jgi:hypothetical protein